MLGVVNESLDPCADSQGSSQVGVFEEFVELVFIRFSLRQV